MSEEPEAAAALSDACSEAPVLLRFARRAMATTFEIVMPFGAPAASDSAMAALEEIDRLDMNPFGNTRVMNDNDVWRAKRLMSHHESCL